MNILLFNLLTCRLKQISIYAFCCCLLISNSVLAWSGSQISGCKNKTHLSKKLTKTTGHKIQVKQIKPTSVHLEKTVKLENKPYNFVVNNCDCDCCNHINHSLIGAVNIFSTNIQQTNKSILVSFYPVIPASYIAPHDIPPI